MVTAIVGQLSTMRKLLDRGAGTVDDQDEVKCMFIRILHGLHVAGIVPYTMKCVCALLLHVLRKQRI